MSHSVDVESRQGYEIMKQIEKLGVSEFEKKSNIKVYRMKNRFKTYNPAYECYNSIMNSIWNCTSARYTIGAFLILLAAPVIFLLNPLGLISHPVKFVEDITKQFNKDSIIFNPKAKRQMSEESKNIIEFISDVKNDFIFIYNEISEDQEDRLHIY